MIEVEIVLYSWSIAIIILKVGNNQKEELNEESTWKFIFP